MFGCCLPVWKLRILRVHVQPFHVAHALRDPAPGDRKGWCHPLTTPVCPAPQPNASQWLHRTARVHHPGYFRSDSLQFLAVEAHGSPCRSSSLLDVGPGSSPALTRANVNASPRRSYSPIQPQSCPTYPAQQQPVLLGRTQESSLSFLAPAEALKPRPPCHRVSGSPTFVLPLQRSFAPCPGRRQPQHVTVYDSTAQVSLS